MSSRIRQFFLWQSFLSAAIFIFFKTSIHHFSPKLHTLVVESLISSSLLIAFIFSHLLFSASIISISSPQPSFPPSASQLFSAFLSIFSLPPDSSSSDDFFSRIWVSVRFIVALGFAGFLSLTSMCCSTSQDHSSMLRVDTVGARGFVLGLAYAGIYVYCQRWVLEFPIIQRPLFFSFKIGLPSAFQKALKLSSAAFLCSSLVLVFLPSRFTHLTMGNIIIEQIILSIGSFFMFLCWELIHNLHQVIYTKRLVFSCSQGSAATKRNPSEPLLVALESTRANSPGSLLQYLAHLDLCMVCEHNVDTWRRAAFFGETGDTYRRVVDICLKPLEDLANSLGQVLEGTSSLDKTTQLSKQLDSSTHSNSGLMDYKMFNTFQLCAWCAKAASCLTARSHLEDKFGVAQLTGCNSSVLSTLLSCLLAVEASMGKKTSLHHSFQVTRPKDIKWANLNAIGKSGSITKKMSHAMHPKAYALADVLRTCVYQVVSVFHNEMLASANSNLLDKVWICDKPPAFGSQELLLQKLLLFLDFRAC